MKSSGGRKLPDQVSAAPQISNSEDEANKQHFPLISYLSIVLMLALVLPALFAMRKTPLSDLGVVVGFGVAYILAVVAHEGGHYLAGRACDLELLAAGLWPLTIVLHGGRWHLARIGLKGFLGFVMMIPRDSRRLRRSLIFLIAGGPLASGILAAAAAATTATAQPRWLTSELSFIGEWSLLFFVMNLIPGRRGAVSTDGYKLWILARGGAKAEDLKASILLTGQMVYLRPREWDPQIFERIFGSAAKSSESSGVQTFRYNWLLDLRRLDEAEEILPRILQQKLDSPNRTVWNSEAAWFYARFRGDLEKAQSYYSEVRLLRKPSSYIKCAVSKASAAIALLEGRYGDAENAAREALSHANEFDNALGAAIAEEITSLLQDIMARKAPSSISS